MGFGMSYGVNLPSNYQNGLYWMYLMQSMQQAQQMQQQKYQQTIELLQKQQEQQKLQQQMLQQKQLEQQQIQQQQLQAQQAAQTTQATVQTTAQGDGQDDGKISLGKKCKNFVKGVGNFFKGMVCDENGKFSWKRTLTTAAVAAGAVALTVATGGAATPFLVAAGATIATVQTGKGIYKAATAKTDAEAEAAWQEIGSGTTALVGSVAGAKGALKAAGAPVPKGNAITSSLRATKDCIKIAGSGAIKGGKALITHPMQSGRAIRAYYNNTVKPNMTEAFSYKNGHKNYTQALEKKLNKNIKDIDNQIKQLNDELAAKPSAKKVSEIEAKIAKLKQERTVAENRLLKNNGKNKSLDILEEQITKVEKKLADPSVSAAEKARLRAVREEFYKSANEIDAHYRVNFNKDIAAKENFIKNLKEQLKTATESDKAAIKAEIKLQQDILKGIKAQKEVEIAQHNIKRAEADITKLNDQLRTATTDAQKENITARINTIEKAIVKDKQILRNANYKVAAQKHLPQVGLAYGSYYLSNPAAQVDGIDEKAQADAYAQQYGFESAEAMQAYINAMNNSQQALNNADQYITQNSQYTSNPYGFTVTTMQPPMQSGLGFEDLYVSPYQQWIY